MELDELHVLQRKAGAQNHAAAVARAGMRGRAGEIRAPITAGRENRRVGAEAVELALHHVQRDHAAAHAVLHDEIQREVFDEERGGVADALLIQRVEHRVAGAIRRGTGAMRGRALAEIRGHAAERALIDLALVRARERQAVVLQLDDRRPALPCT